MSSSTPIFTAPSWADAGTGASSRTAPSAETTALRQRNAGGQARGLAGEDACFAVGQPHGGQESGQGPGVSSRARWPIVREEPGPEGPGSSNFASERLLWRRRHEAGDGRDVTRRVRRDDRRVAGADLEGLDG